MSKNVQLSTQELTWTQAQKAREGLINLYGIKAFLLSASASDTVFTYHLYTEAKINRAKQEAASHFINGIKYAMV